MLMPIAKATRRMTRRVFLGLAGVVSGVVIADRIQAQVVRVVTIPIHVHLMKSKESRFDDDNAKVDRAFIVLQTLFTADGAGTDGKSVGAVWKGAGVAFSLESHDTRLYTGDDIRARDNIVPGSCDPQEEDLVLFRALQQKFGLSTFRGLQVYMWANILAGAGWRRVE